MPPRKPANRARSIRLTDEEWEHLAELGRRWGPVVPLTPTTAMRQLIRREPINRDLLAACDGLLGRLERDGMDDPTTRAVMATARAAIARSRGTEPTTTNARNGRTGR